MLFCVGDIAVNLTVRVLPPGVALANTPFTFYNCSARHTYIYLYQLHIGSIIVCDSVTTISAKSKFDRDEAERVRRRKLESGKCRG